MKTRNDNIARALLTAVLIIFAFGVAAAETVSGGNGENQSTTIYSVSVAPAKVASGETILIEAVFSMFDDSPRRSLPMEYFCEIERQGELIFQSPVKTMSVMNGAKSHLEIKLQATGGKGDYNVAVELIRPDGNIREEGVFSIVSPMEARMYRAALLKENPSTKSAVENRLPGTWQFIPKDPKTKDMKTEDPKTPVQMITISNKNGELTANVSRENLETLWVKLQKSRNGLVIRSKSEDPRGDCWYTVEDVITFNDRMDDMPVRSKVLEGSRCVSVGRVSEATLHRVE